NGRSPSVDRRALCRRPRLRRQGAGHRLGPAEGPPAPPGRRRPLSRTGPRRAARRALGGTMAKLDRDGVKIHYEVHGSGPMILLSHGYSSTARMWDGQIAALKDRYQVIVWDMRGHGESDYPADQSL